MQQQLSRYYGNATGCIGHVTKENPICNNMIPFYFLSLFVIIVIVVIIIFPAVDIQTRIMFGLMH
jgi:hypothetical protein